MKTKEKPKAYLLTDACVLIDFCKEDVNLLGLVSRHIGQIIVPKPILRKEVNQLTVEDCDRLGLVIYTPTMEQLERAVIPRSGLSEQDKLCLFIAIDEGYSLFTNDTTLIKIAKKEKVDVHWGLELVVRLAHKGVLTHKQAVETARSICRRTPFPEEMIMKEFQKLLAETR
jgi:rRNA-processing protein FCF1